MVSERAVGLISDRVLTLDSATSKSMVVFSKCSTCLTNKNLYLLQGFQMIVEKTNA